MVLVQKKKFNRFQGIKEDEFFSKLTRLQQVGSVEEFTHQWESLSKRVFGLSDKQRLKTYLGGLKPYLQKELKLHDIPNVEVARHKAKAAERKLEGIKTRGDNHYRQEKETQCRYCVDTWSLGHQCHKPQSYAYEMENRSKSSNNYADNRKKKKTYVVDAAMIGPLVINVGTMRQYSVKQKPQNANWKELKQKAITIIDKRKDTM